MGRVEKIKKKVVHIDTGRSWRGGQNQVFLLIKELKNYGFSQKLITPSGSPLGKKVKKINIGIINLNPANDIDIFRAYKLKKVVKNIRPDIVHMHTAKSLGIGVLALKKAPGKKIFTRRVGFPLRNNFLNRFKYSFPDRVVVISDFIKEQMVKEGFREPDRIYSSVDSEVYINERDYNFKNKKLKIGMAGALDLNDKDYRTFIDTAEEILAGIRHPDIKFLIAGSGKDRKKIEQLIAEKGLGNSVFIEGFIENMPRFYQKLDILFHAARFEGLGTSVLQGMASGLPVLAARVGGIPEIVEEDKNGLLFKKEDAKDAARQLTRLIKNPDLRVKLGKLAPNRVQINFSPRKMADNYLQLYRAEV